MAEFSISHVSMVPDDLAYMLRWHVFLLCVNKTKLSFLRVALCLQLLPFPCWNTISKQKMSTFETRQKVNGKEEKMPTFLLQFFLRHVIWDWCRRGYAWWHPWWNPSEGEGGRHCALLLKEI